MKLNSAQEELRRAVSGVNVAMRKMRGRQTHLRHGLTFAQYGLLFALEGGQVFSARDLGEKADLSPASVTQMLDGMEAAGLVERTRSAQDKRVVLTTLTRAGEEAIGEVRVKMESRWETVLADFSDADLTVAVAVLDRVAQHFYALATEDVEKLGVVAPKAAQDETDETRTAGVA
jgi:DNA-binding MarR family transcriptional regulator